MKKRRPTREVLIEGRYSHGAMVIYNAVNIQTGNQCEDWVNIEAPLHFDERKVRLVLELASDRRRREGRRDGAGKSSGEAK